MEGVHDLGGKEGFGPIDVTAPGFKHHWEERMWAVAKHSGHPEWTLDWWRHVVERMDPPVYLSVSYFEKWCLTFMTAYVGSGTFSIEEVLAGTTEMKGTPPPPSGIEGARQRLKANEVLFDRDVDTPPAFAVGDTVLTVDRVFENHTRLPGYARSAVGEIIAHHGGHLFADASARGEDRGEHLYTVAFPAQELFGPEADARDSVTLDLWEPYLERP